MAEIGFFFFLPIERLKTSMLCKKIELMRDFWCKAKIAVDANDIKIKTKIIINNFFITFKVSSVEDLNK